MKNKRCKLLIVFPIILVIYSISINPIANDTILISDSFQDRPKSSVSHAIISIDGNAELDSFADKTGGGTAGDPYIIQNFEIDGGGLDVPIIIKNTNKYLTIQNCELSQSEDATESAGIYLDNVDNVKISKNLVRNNLKYGIFLIDCNNVNITNNEIRNNANSGIHIDSSVLLGTSNVMIYNNDILSNAVNGINSFWGNDISDLNITGNYVFNSGNEGMILSGDGYIVEKNVINISKTLSHGIWFAGDVSLIKNNEIYLSEANGISIIGDNNNVSYNFIKDSGSDGIYTGGNFNDIINNTIINVEVSGIYLKDDAIQSNVRNNYIEFFETNSFGNNVTCIVDLGINNVKEDNICNPKKRSSTIDGYYIELILLIGPAMIVLILLLKNKKIKIV
jgi:parallel beta-helix repeat protein